MRQDQPTDSGTPQETIAAALAQIEAAYPRLAFPDHWTREAAHRYIGQGLNAIRYHVRRAEPFREDRSAALVE